MSLTYGTASVVTEKSLSPFSHWMFPNVAHQYKGILHLLLHFGWMWIGLFYLAVENVEQFLQDVISSFSQSGVCFEFLQRLQAMSFSDGFNELLEKGLETYKTGMGSSATALVVHGEVQTIMSMRAAHQVAECEDDPIKTKGKVWIMTAQMDFVSLPYQRNWDIDIIIHGALSFAIHSEEVLGFYRFLQMKNPTLVIEDAFIKAFWQKAFDCSFPSSRSVSEDGPLCTGEEKLEILPASVFEMRMTAHSYSIYNAVYSIAHALHDLHVSQFRQRWMSVKGRRQLLNEQLWQVMSSGTSFLCSWCSNLL
ncbi:UNVERIFIED_CONTAM: hypothetical protein K2H54_034258 [Gekko kuhli]